MTTGHASRFWQDRPTLVTGATGFLGGWLVARLLEAGIGCLRVN
jgi:nucleoside-diphosphate-sugar epimerase